MEALSLDPNGYDGTYKLIGGRGALDLVNTISWPGGPKQHDWLFPPANAIGWATAVGLVNSVERVVLAKEFVDDPLLADGELESLVSLRSALDAVLRPLCMHAEPLPSTVAVLNERLAECPSPSVDATSLKLIRRPVERLTDIQPVLVLDAADIVTSFDHQRLGHCPSCGWLFVDATRNRSRRWCDMADCGSRDKARRYYRRQQH